MNYVVWFNHTEKLCLFAKGYKSICNIVEFFIFVPNLGIEVDMRVGKFSLAKRFFKGLEVSGREILYQKVYWCISVLAF